MLEYILEIDTTKWDKEKENSIAQYKNVPRMWIFPERAWSGKVADEGRVGLRWVAAGGYYADWGIEEGDVGDCWQYQFKNIWYANISFLVWNIDYVCGIIFKGSL